MTIDFDSLLQGTPAKDAPEPKVGKSPSIDFDSLMGSKAAPAEAPGRNLFARANDFAIDTANAAAGLVKSGVDLVAPGSKASNAVGDFIKSGEESQSDFKKAGRQKLSDDMKTADGEFDKVGKYLSHVKDDPMEVAAQAFGNIGPFKALGLAFQAAGWGTKASMMAAGSLSAGEVRGNILDKVLSKDDADLAKENTDYAQLRAGGMSEADAKKEIGTKFIQHLPELAATSLVGALGGKYGLEGIASGLGRQAKSRAGAGLISLADEGIEGAVEQLSTNVAVKRIDPTQKLGEDVLLNAVQEGMPGGLGGAVSHHGGGHSTATATPSADQIATDVAATPPPAAAGPAAAPAAPAAPAGPSKSQQFVSSAFADVGGDTSVHSTQDADRGIVALSLQQIEKHDGEPALAQAIEHLAGGNQDFAEQLYEASQDKALLEHGRKQVKSNSMAFIEANDGIRTDAGITQDPANVQEQAASASQPQTDTQTAPQAATPQIAAQVAAVKSGLLSGAVVSLDMADNLDLNGLQHAIATGPDGSQQLIVAKDEQTVQAAVARANEVGLDQMGAEMFGPAQDKAVIQRVSPSGEVVHEAVVAPDQVHTVDEVPGSSTQVRPVADVLAERTPAAEAQATAQTEDGKVEPAFFNRTAPAVAPREIKVTEVARTGASQDFLDKVNDGYGLSGRNEIDPASIIEVRPADKSLLRMADAVKVAFGTTVTFIYLPQGNLMRKSGKVFNNFGGVAIPAKNRVLLNVSSGSSALHVLAHELTHVLEKQHPEAFNELEITVLSRMRAKAARALNDRIQAAMKSETGQNSAGPIRQEVVAEAIGELAQDPSLWADVFAHIGDKPTLAQTFYKAAMDVIATLQRAFTRAGYTTGLKDVATVKKAVVSAFKEWSDQHEQSFNKPAPAIDFDKLVTPATTSDNANNEQRPAAVKAESASPTDTGGAGGNASTVAVDSRPEQGTRGPSLKGLPADIRVDGQLITFGGFKPAQDAARAYAESAGIEYKPPTEYAKVDPERAKRIADEFESMEHAPNDPEVKAAYEAMIKETVAQYEAMMKTGLTVEFIKGDDPYGNPRNAILDVTRNNHLWVFKTDSGFGASDADISGNPLLAPTDIKISGETAVANDIFRAVHDYFGHIAEGVGFRADGEENAWRKHSAMYSPLARRAATAELRGQNSWLNFGPYAEFNRTANAADTKYADQKTGLLPQWVVDEGRTDEPVTTGRLEAKEAPKDQAEANMEGEGGGVYFARNALKMESVQDALDFTSTADLKLNLGDALDRGAWATAFHEAKDAAQRKELMSHLGDQVIEKFADSKIKVSRWIQSLTSMDQKLTQRLEGDMRRSDTVRSTLEKDVKDKFTQPMMKAITAAAKASKLGADQTKKMAGYWITATYASEASAQLITKDRVALREAQATGDATKIAQAQQDLADRIADVNGAIGAPKKRGVGGGMNNAEAAQMIKNVEARIDPALLQAIAQPIYDMMAWKKAKDLSAGKVTQTAVNSWLNSPRYVPLTGDPRFDKESTDVFSSGGQVNQDADKEMNGRKDSVADDGIDASFSAVIKSINFAAMQDFKKTLNKTYTDAQAAGVDIGLTREAVTGIMRTSDDVIIYRDTQVRPNGTEFTNAQAFKFKDKRIMEAIKKDNQESLNALLKVISAPTRWYARLVTQFMPMFAPINLVRDIWERSELLRTRTLLDAQGNKVDTKKAARAAIADSINRDVWRASMGKAWKMGGMTQARGDLEEMIRLGGSSTTGDYLERSSGDLEASIRGDASKLGHATNKVMHGVEAYNNMFEMVPSLAIYRSLKAQGMEAKDAAAATLDLMNFRKKGTTMPAIKALYVFAQPAATGGYNLAQYLNTRTGKIRFATQVAIGTALYALLKGAWGDDDDEEIGNKLDNLSNFTVERNIPVKLGDYVLKLPVGFGPPQLAWMSASVINRVASGRYSVADGLGELAKGWAKNFAPVAPSDMEISKRPVDFLAQTFIPTVLKPLLNIAQDITSLGGPLTPVFKDKNKLKSDQAQRNTPPIYSDIAKQIQQTIGVDMYPDHVKAITDGVFVGPFQQIVMMTIDADAKKLRGEPGRVPLVSQIIDSINDRQMLNSVYFRVMDDMDKGHRQYGSLKAAGDPEHKITPEMVAAEKSFKQFEAAAKLVGVQRAAVKKQTGLDDETRSEKIQAIENRADLAHRKLLVQYFQAQQ